MKSILKLFILFVAMFLTGLFISSCEKPLAHEENDSSVTLCIGSEAGDSGVFSIQTVEGGIPRSVLDENNLSIAIAVFRKEEPHTQGIPKVIYMDSGYIR